MEAGKPIGLLDLVKMGAVEAGKTIELSDLVKFGAAVTVHVNCPFCEGRGEDCGSCEGTGTYEQDLDLRDLLLASWRGYIDRRAGGTE